KLAANITYRMQGYHWGFFTNTDNAGAIYAKDRSGSWAATIPDANYRQLAYNWQSDQGITQSDSRVKGAWYTEWIMVEKPEQSKYTTVLTVFWQDNLKDEDDYIFVPTLRRVLRLSSSARCAPLLGSDLVRDDQRFGWNGGVGKFAGSVVG